MYVDKQYQSLVNRLYELVVGNVQTFSAWGFYLLHSDFDGEPELRNKLGVIWICSLLDSVEAQQRFLPAIEKEAQDLGFESLVENSRQLGNFCILVIEFLEQYSRDEQLLLSNLRNQWVHS